VWRIPAGSGLLGGEVAVLLAGEVEQRLTIGRALVVSSVCWNFSKEVTT
jgi:hypothetical protein